MTIAPTPMRRVSSVGRRAPADGAPLRNVIVMGASYAGAHAAELLAKSLPPTHRLVLIERRSHFAHVYVWPRFTTIQGHAAKSFVPFTEFLRKAQDLGETCPAPEAHIERASSVIVHAQIIGLTDTHVLLDQDMCKVPGLTEDLFEDVNGTLQPEGEVAGGKQCCGAGGCMPARRCRGRAVPYDRLIYALGCRLPTPLFSEARTKCEGVDFLQQRHEQIRAASSILIVGGGALGIQYATDIADTFGSSKHVTLIHSRQRLLPLFDEQLHDAALRRMRELGVEVILGERVVMPDGPDPGGELVIRTEAGRKLVSDMRIWATGQLPNSSLMRDYAPDTVDKHGFIRTTRTLQLAATGHRSRISAIGDCIDGFGAIKAGHTGWNQAGIAAGNILKLLQAEADGRPAVLDLYEPTPPMIRLTLGLRESISQILEDGELKISYQRDLPPETHWRHTWDMLGADSSDAHA